MGLFSFIKNAGAKVFGIGKTTEEETVEAAMKAAELEKAKARKLLNVVETLGFEVLRIPVID